MYFSVLQPLYHRQMESYILADDLEQARASLLKLNEELGRFDAQKVDERANFTQVQENNQLILANILGKLGRHGEAARLVEPAMKKLLRTHFIPTNLLVNYAGSLEQNLRTNLEFLVEDGKVAEAEDLVNDAMIHLDAILVGHPGAEELILTTKIRLFTNIGNLFLNQEDYRHASQFFGQAQLAYEATKASSWVSHGPTMIPYFIAEIKGYYASDPKRARIKEELLRNNLRKGLYTNSVQGSQHLYHIALATAVLDEELKLGKKQKAQEAYDRLLQLHLQHDASEDEKRFIGFSWQVWNILSVRRLRAKMLLALAKYEVEYLLKEPQQCRLTRRRVRQAIAGINPQEKTTFTAKANEEINILRQQLVNCGK
ncbi:MAG: hypothetical protein AAFN92_19855 [Bacteroidota bacterium]